jgi:hypothetical protein
MKKQTAVDWLYERFLFAGYAAPAEWKEKAKEMQKEHIQEAWIEGGGYSRLSEENDRMLAEKYYNETYENK